MKHTTLPRRRYGTGDYPFLAEAAIGRVIPIGYGTFVDLVPVEINTYTRRFKVVDQAIASITRIASNVKDPLVKDTDYFEFLAEGEFRLNKPARLVAGATYFFSVQSDYAINGTNYIQLGQNYDVYDGVSYEVNGSGVWTPTINTLLFQIWGSEEIGGSLVAIAQNPTWDDETGPLNLRDAAARTKVGQSFKPAVIAGSAVDTSGDTNGSTGLISGMTDTSDFNVDEYVTVSAGFPTTGPYKILDKTASSLILDENSNSEQFNITVTSAIMRTYPRRIRLYGISQTVTPPTGNLWITIYEAVNPESIIGVVSESKLVSQISGGEIEFDFVDSVGDIGSEFVCDIVTHSPAMNQVADILPDVMTAVMGKASGLLDATELANLAADRTQNLRVFLGDETIEFGDFAAKLEAGQLFKIVPLGDGTYGTIVPEAGEPANLLTLRDHDFLSFRMELDQSEVHQKIDFFYGQNPADPDAYPAVSVSSDIARFFYMNESSCGVETYVLGKSDSETLAGSYSSRYEVPIIKAVFAVHAKGIELLPWRDKVKLYRTRASYAGGTLNGVLFRIIKLVKRPATDIVEITAAIWGNSAT